jgi:hypothetical protein
MHRFAASPREGFLRDVVYQVAASDRHVHRRSARLRNRRAHHFVTLGPAAEASVPPAHDMDLDRRGDEKIRRLDGRHEEVSFSLL